MRRAASSTGETGKSQLHAGGAGREGRARQGGRSGQGVGRGGEWGREEGAGPAFTFRVHARDNLLRDPAARQAVILA